jgi:two-component sensor histidine kinase
MESQGTERELRLRLRERELLAELGACALRAKDLDVLLQEAARLVAEGMRSSSKILEYLPKEDLLLVRAGIGWREGVVGNARLDSSTGSPAGYAFKTNQPVISNSFSDEARFRTPRLLLEHGIQRAINVIVRSEGEVFGVLEADSKDSGCFSEDDIAFLQAAANLLGVAIERHRHEARLREALESRDLLFREADHRIKNSLQLVASLLTLQRSRLADPDAVAALDGAIARVQAVAQAHRALQQSPDLRTLSFGQMLSDLCRYVGRLSPAVAVECTCEDDLQLDAERAIPLGLAVNELLANTVRHAYPAGRSGVVRVAATLGDRELTITITDQGVGMPPGYERTGSLGSIIVRSLAKQIGAELSVRSELGSGTSVTMRVLRHAASASPA